MKFNYRISDTLKQAALFRGISTSAYDNILNCLCGNRRKYRRGEQLHQVGEKMTCAGLILRGEVDVVLFNEAGNQLSINRFGKGDMFGESFACLQTENCPVSIYAVTDNEVLFLDLSLLFTPQKMACVYAAKVTENLVRLLAEKNVFLNQKVQILAQKKIRDKIKVFLQTEMDKQQPSGGQEHYVIRFSRDEMARYLGVDRSALSRELCNMRNEGVLLFERNNIELLDPTFLLGYPRA